jgi:hypothetical protein
MESGDMTGFNPAPISASEFNMNPSLWEQVKAGASAFGEEAKKVAANPMVIRAAARTGAILGGKGSVAEGLGQLAEQTVAGQAAAKASNAANTSPAYLAEQMKKGTAALKTLGEIDSTVMPPGYARGASDAYFMKPGDVLKPDMSLQNPTLPSAASSEPATAGAPQQVQTATPQVDSRMFIDPDFAGTMDPGQLQYFFTNQIAGRTVAVGEREAKVREDTQALIAQGFPVEQAYKKALTIAATENAADSEWKRSPEGLSAQKELNVAATNAQIQGLKDANKLTLDNINSMLVGPDGKPNKLAMTPIPGIPNMTIGQGLNAGVLSPHGFAGIIEAADVAQKVAQTKMYNDHLIGTKTAAKDALTAKTLQDDIAKIDDQLIKISSKLDPKEVDPKLLPIVSMNGGVRSAESNAIKARLLKERKAIAERLGKIVPGYVGSSAFDIAPVDPNAAGVLEYERDPATGRLRLKRTGTSAVSSPYKAGSNPEAETIFKNMFNPIAVPGT